MGFFADGRDEEYEEAEARELDGQFVTKSAASRAYMGFTRLFPKILKYLVLAFIVIMYGLFFFRIQTSKPPSALRDWHWTQSAITQYQADPSAFALYSQEPMEDISEFKTKEGYRFVFQTSYIQYVPSLQQFQLTARYNKSIQEPLMAQFGLSSLPTGEWFLYALKDENGNLYHADYCTPAQRNVNHFRRLVFCNVPMETVTKLDLVVVYAGHADFDNPLFLLNVYQKDFPIEAEQPDCPKAPDALSPLH